MFILELRRICGWPITGRFEASRDRCSAVVAFYYASYELLHSAGLAILIKLSINHVRANPKLLEMLIKNLSK